MSKLWIAMLGMALAGAAGAKLPPPSPETLAKADEAKQKTAWSDKVAAYQLCKAQDRVAAGYRQKKGSQAAPAVTPVVAPVTAPVTAPVAPPVTAPAAAAPATAATPATPAVAAAAPAIPACQDPGAYVAAAAAAKVGVADSLPVPAAGKPLTPAEARK